MDDTPRGGLRRDRMLLGAVLLGALGHLATYYPSLPERVASHFDAAGRPDGWMSRDAFATTLVLVYALLGGGFLLLPRVLARLPDSMVNVPNKTHWLAPPRRAASLARLGRRLLRFGAVNVVLVVFLVHQTLAVNVGAATTLRGFVPALVAYALYAVIWTVGLVRDFRLPPGAAAE